MCRLERSGLERFDATSTDVSEASGGIVTGRNGKSLRKAYRCEILSVHLVLRDLFDDFEMKHHKSQCVSVMNRKRRDLSANLVLDIGVSGLSYLLEVSPHRGWNQGLT